VRFGPLGSQPKTIRVEVWQIVLSGSTTIRQSGHQRPGASGVACLAVLTGNAEAASQNRTLDSAGGFRFNG